MTMLNLAQYPLFSYGMYLLAGILVFVSFFLIYTRVTPYSELALIRQGNMAAALSLGGALLGFAFPIAAAISQHVNLLGFALWGSVALACQLCGFLLLSWIFKGIKDEIESCNTAFGALMGVAAMCLGLINAACQF